MKINGDIFFWIYDLLGFGIIGLKEIRSMNGVYGLCLFKWGESLRMITPS
jgi:hypothetical protein